MTRAEYYNLHKYCPKCGDQESMISCESICTSNWAYVIDENRVWCNCGWKGKKHDMVEEKMSKRKDT